MKSITFFCLLFFTFQSFNSLAIELEREKYRVESAFEVNPFYNGICHEDSIIWFCDNSIFEVILIEGTIVRAKLLEGYKCEGFAKVSKIFCFDSDKLVPGSVIKLEDEKKWDFSGGVAALTVPFKFDPTSFKVFPSGEIGAIGGFQFTNKKKPFELLTGVIAGFSTIPLNDLNATNAAEVKTAFGITLGGGVTFNIWRGFNFGVYYAVDLYNVDNTRYSKDWISFGFGYNFLSFKSDQTRKQQPDK